MHWDSSINNLNPKYSNKGKQCTQKKVTMPDGAKGRGRCSIICAIAEEMHTLCGAGKPGCALYGFEAARRTAVCSSDLLSALSDGLSVCTISLTIRLRPSADLMQVDNKKKAACSVRPCRVALGSDRWVK